MVLPGPECATCIWPLGPCTPTLQLHVWNAVGAGDVGCSDVRPGAVWVLVVGNTIARPALLGVWVLCSMLVQPVTVAVGVAVGMLCAVVLEVVVVVVVEKFQFCT
jgi:hypothetical protein